MTIRRRLIVAFAFCSMIVAVAISGGIGALVQIKQQVAGVRMHAVGEIRASNDLVECLSTLSRQLGDAVQAQARGDSPGLGQLGSNLNATFERTRQAINALRSAAEAEHQQSEFSGNTVAAAAELQEASAVARLDADMQRLEKAVTSLSANPRGPETAATLASLDEQGDALLTESLAFQEQLGDGMIEELSAVSHRIGSIAKLAGLFGGAMFLIAIIQGLAMSRELGRRLDRLRTEAERIGLGDLTSQLEVKGQDEIDGVATAFNAMVRALRDSREQLEHDALHDALTGLPNRSLFLERVSQRIADARRTDDFRYAVYLLDLDRFKFQNDTLGHAAGDALLQVFAERLSSLVARLDAEHGSRNTVARLFGDEFIILVERTSDSDGNGFADRIAQLIQNELSAVIQIGDQSVRVSASIGVVVGNASYDQPASLLRDADAALSHAKGAGRACHAVFNPGMQACVRRRLRLEQGIAQAAERGEFHIHFQMIRDLTNGEQVGLEALLRWNHQGEPIGPEEFIPIAEETGEIVAIGAWVIENACKQLRAWRDDGVEIATISVNVSARQLGDAQLVTFLQKCLLANRLKPSDLIVEITESTLVEEGPSMVTLAAIRKLGIRVFVDDFGTGYSTLSGLDRYVIDGIKIDRSFVMKSKGRRDKMAILQAVVDLAHNLRMPVVAEGVETSDQLAMLQGLGCDRGQGFLFSRPVPAQEVARLFRLMSKTRGKAA